MESGTVSANCKSVEAEMSPSLVDLASEYTLSLTAKDAVWYGGDAIGTAFDGAALTSDEVPSYECGERCCDVNFTRHRSGPLALDMRLEQKQRDVVRTN